MRKLEATKLITCGDSSRLECKVTGSPVISFKWFKDEMEISSSPKYTVSSADFVASLEIVNCTVEDSGDYVCMASSEAGSDRCSSTVTVKGWFSFSVIYFNYLFCTRVLIVTSYGARTEAENVFRSQSTFDFLPLHHHHGWFSSFRAAIVCALLGVQRCCEGY